MKKIFLRVVIVLVLLVVVGLTALFFSLNGIVKKGVETVGPPMTKTDVRLESAALSPFSGSGKLSGLFVGNPPGYTNTGFAIQFGSVAVAVKIGSVFSDTIIVDSIDIEQPEICLEGTLSGNNLSQLLDNLKGASATQEKEKNAPAPAGQSKPKKLIVKDLVLNGAKVRANVSGLGKHLDETITIPNIHLHDVGTADGGASPAELCRQLLDPILADAVKAAGDELTKKGVEVLTKQGTDALNKAGSNVLNNLLQRK